MNLDELKSNWKQAGKPTKNKFDLKKMMRIKNHPELKKIRRKLIIESTVLIIFLVLYYDGFDGAQKPFWVNLFLIVGTSIYILNDLLGYFTVKNPITDHNLHHAVAKTINKLEKLKKRSLVSSLVFHASVILFFTSVIGISDWATAVFTAWILIVLATSYISYKYWTSRINHFKKVLEEFETKKSI